MMANNDMSRWCVLYTAPKSERKLVQRLHAADSTPAASSTKTQPGNRGANTSLVCPFHFLNTICIGQNAIYPFVVSQGGVSFLLDAEGQKLFVCADKAELPAKFVHLLK